MKKFMFFIGLLVSILVAQGQSVTISTNPASPIICNGQGIALTANAVAGFPDTYAWSNGANTQTISVSPNATATYTVTITFDEIGI